MTRVYENAFCHSSVERLFSLTDSVLTRYQYTPLEVNEVGSSLLRYLVLVEVGRTCQLWRIHVSNCKIWNIFVRGITRFFFVLITVHLPWKKTWPQKWIRQRKLHWSLGYVFWLFCITLLKGFIFLLWSTSTTNLVSASDQLPRVGRLSRISGTAQRWKITACNSKARVSPKTFSNCNF